MNINTLFELFKKLPDYAWTFEEVMQGENFSVAVFRNNFHLDSYQYKSLRLISSSTEESFHQIPTKYLELKSGKRMGRGVLLLKNIICR